VADLSPEARALVEAGREAFRPAADDQERILAALRARLGEPPGAAPNAAGSGSSATGGIGWTALAAALVGVGLAIGGAVYALRGGEAHVSTPPAARPSVSVVAPTPSAAQADPMPAGSVAPEASVTAPLPTPAAHALASRHTGDRLAEEVALMSRAETELHAGRYSNALRLLDEYRHEFPNGTLSQERLAARVQALCALGRVNEAEADLARLTRLSPESPHEGRARAACATNAKH
jgi:hypothetical protein